MITVESITYRYTESRPSVLENFSASFERGEITAICGKNGCGKTTLSKLLTGILRPQAGSIYIDGADTGKMDLFEIGQRVGYVFSNPDRQLFCDSVYQEMLFGLQNLNAGDARDRADSFLKRFGLVHKRGEYPGNLSHGEKQRLALAAVLAMGTDYLVLDEPTTGLDALRQNELGEILSRIKREMNCGIVFTSHKKDFIVKYADRELGVGQ